MGRRRGAHRGRARLRVGALVLGAPGLGRGRAPDGAGQPGGAGSGARNDGIRAGRAGGVGGSRARRPETAPHGDDTPRGRRQRRDATDDDTGTRAPTRRTPHPGSGRRWACCRGTPSPAAPAPGRASAGRRGAGRWRWTRVMNVDARRRPRAPRAGRRRARVGDAREHEHRRRRTRSTRRSPGARRSLVRRAVASAPISEPTLRTENSSVKVVSVAAERAGARTAGAPPGS